MSDKAVSIHKDSEDFFSTFDFKSSEEWKRISEITEVEAEVAIRSDERAKVEAEYRGGQYLASMHALAQKEAKKASEYHRRAQKAESALLKARKEFNARIKEVERQLEAERNSYAAWQDIEVGKEKNVF